jgi:hypothetical protein
VDFPVNVYDMVAILGPNNQWKISTSQALNAAYIESGSKAPSALLLDYDLVR